MYEYIKQKCTFVYIQKKPNINTTKIERSEEKPIPTRVNNALFVQRATLTTNRLEYIDNNE